MFDLFAVLLPRDEAKQKWKFYNGDQDPPRRELGINAQNSGPRFENGQSRERSSSQLLGSACLPNPEVRDRDKHLFNRAPRSATTTPSLSGRHSKSTDALTNMRQFVHEWVRKQGITTLYEAAQNFLNEYGPRGDNPRKADLSIDERTFMTGLSALGVRMSGQEAHAHFMRHDGNKDGRLTMAEFGALCLPGMDRNQPK